MSTVVISRFPSTNNHLRNSSNLKQQATIHDGRVIVQPLLGRQNSYVAGTPGTRINTTRGNYLGQQRVVKCFNFQREGHMARQCPKLKKKRDATWFRDKVLLVEAQENGKVLSEKELDFLADPGIAEGPVIQSVITHNATYQADDLDAYDSDCAEISTAKAVLMANLSSYGLDVLSEEKEAKNIDTEFALEKIVKELDNIVCKMGQSAQIVLMLTKPQVFYDNNLKQALGFQNPFYLKKAQQIRLMLYDGNVIAKETNVISIADSEETLMLQEENFGKRFVPQQELFDEQALHPNTDQSASSPVKIEAPRELPKIISQDIVNIVVNSSLDINTSVNVNSSVAMNDSVNYVAMCNKCLKLEAELIKQYNIVEKDEYNKLSKRFSELEQHCISLEIAMQLNKEIFQKNNTSVNQTEPSFDQLFNLNNLKAELQAKVTTIEKLKANIKRLNKTSTTNSVKKDIDEIETINIELEHRVTKLIAENEHLKQTYKQLYDSIKPSCVQAKEYAESLVNKLNLKKFKGKDIVDNAAQVSNATTIAPGMYKLDPVILAPKVKNIREAHEYYLKHTMEQADILKEVVEQAKSRNPLDSASYSACMYVKLIQELPGYVRDTCPDIHKPSEKLVAVTPINKKKTVRFANTVTSSGNIPKVPNRPLLSSTGVNPFTSASGSKSLGNTKNDRIPRTLSINEKNKHPVKGVKALCSVCNECLFDANHAMCLIDHVNSMNVRAKSVSKKNKKRKEWKPTGKVFNSIGCKWKPTGRTFSLVGNITNKRQLDKDEFQERWGIHGMPLGGNQSVFECHDSKFTLDYDSQMTDTYFVDTLESRFNTSEIHYYCTRKPPRQYDRRVNKRQLQTQESKINTGKAVDVDLVDTKSIRTDLTVQDESNRSGNDTDTDDANIKPIYDEEPMAEVQLTAECNIFAIGQQHIEQPKIINEGRVDQYPEQCQVKSPMLDLSPDNQTTDN
ncbi:retrovirus-related pol polyprotein from transposon TNT 1-94 [Tanacetum coccineum]